MNAFEWVLYWLRRLYIVLFPDLIVQPIEEQAVFEAGKKEAVVAEKSEEAERTERDNLPIVESSDMPWRDYDGKL